MSEALFNELSRSEKWINGVNSAIDGTGFESSTRSRVSISLFHISLEHEKGIYTLINKQYFGSALALLRPQFEAYIRGMWVSWCAEDSQIEQITDGKADLPRIYKMIDAIESTEFYEKIGLSKIKEVILNPLNDFTHGGILQINARNKETEINNNYDEQTIISALKTSSAISLQSLVAIARMVDDIELSNKILNLHQSIYSE